MVKLFVEGGGHHNPDLVTDCRRAFHELFKRAGIQRKPKVVACGSREDAYRDFCHARAEGLDALLLVDSEGVISEAVSQGPASAWRPWLHLKQSDTWTAPPDAQDLNCHLMVQSMESWLLADPPALMTFFGSRFDSERLPTPSSAEALSPKESLTILRKASSKCVVAYDKGKHSFKLLRTVDPQRLTNASPWAARLIDHLRSL